MMRKNWLWTLLALVPLGIGGVLFARSQVGPEVRPEPAPAGYVCPLTGEELPCEKCCPLNQESEDSAIGATRPNCCQASDAIPSESQVSQDQQEDGFICPLTGEELPCEKCCPPFGVVGREGGGTRVSSP